MLSLSTWMVDQDIDFLIFFSNRRKYSRQEPVTGNEGVFIKRMSYCRKIKLEDLKPNFNSSKVYIIHNLYFSFFDGKIAGTRGIDRYGEFLDSSSHFNKFIK